MIVASLQSGSHGNCYITQWEGVTLFVDAGIPWRRAQTRMAELGLAPGSLAGLLLTHEHTDHSSNVGVFHRAAGMPIALSIKTAEQIRTTALRKVAPEWVRCFRPGDVLEMGPFRVETFRVEHDAVEPVGYVVEAGGRRVGFITDLGRASRQIQEILATLDGVFIESNFDGDMLTQNANYPALLKERIRGWRGHLENRASASLIKRHATPRLRHVVLSHLSEDNNHPDLALAAHRREWEGELPLWPPPQLTVAPRHGPSRLIEL